MMCTVRVKVRNRVRVKEHIPLSFKICIGLYQQMVN